MFLFFMFFGVPYVLITTCGFWGVVAAIIYIVVLIAMGKR
jgi:hypothetical protein